MRKTVGLLPLIPILLLMFTSPVSADMVFHTTRLTFSATGLAAGSPALVAGQVVDIHPSGPVNGAIERYMINGAKPNTAYQVELRIFANCAGVTLDTTPLMKIDTALLTTNSVGFAQGSFVFTEASLSGFEGQSFGVLWTLLTPPTGASVVAYDTSCIAVTVG